jgi:hypothetical protein
MINIGVARLFKRHTAKLRKFYIQEQIMPNRFMKIKDIIEKFE